VPFRGVVVAELGVDDAGVVVDQSYASPGAPRYLTALVSAEDVAFESYLLVGLPDQSPHHSAAAQAGSAAAAGTMLGTQRVATADEVAVAVAHAREEVETSVHVRIRAAVELALQEHASDAITDHALRKAASDTEQAAQLAANGELHLRVKYLESELDRERNAVSELLPLKEDARRVRVLEQEVMRATEQARQADHRAQDALAQADRLAVEAQRLAREVERLSESLHAASARDAARDAVEERALTQIHELAPRPAKPVAEVQVAPQSAPAAELVAAHERQRAALNDQIQSLRTKLQQTQAALVASDAALGQAQADADAQIEETLSGVADLESEWERRETELVADAETRLVERAAYVRELEAKLVHGEWLLRELLARVAIADVASAAAAPNVAKVRATTDVAALEREVERLAQEVVLRDAELQVRGWGVRLATVSP
jgi:hypothetical protein